MFGASHGRCGSTGSPTKRNVMEPKRRSIGTFLFTEKSRISAALNDRDFLCVVEAEHAPTDVKCWFCVRFVESRHATTLRCVLSLWLSRGETDFRMVMNIGNKWLCMPYGRMIIRPYKMWCLYEFYVILLNNTTKILWNMPQEIIFATFAVASAAIIQRLRQTLHNEKAS